MADTSVTLGTPVTPVMGVLVPAVQNRRALCHVGMPCFKAISRLALFLVAGSVPPSLQLLQPKHADQVAQAAAVLVPPVTAFLASKMLPQGVGDAESRQLNIADMLIKTAASLAAAMPSLASLGFAPNQAFAPSQAFVLAMLSAASSLVAQLSDCCCHSGSPAPPRDPAIGVPLQQV